MKFTYLLLVIFFATVSSAFASVMTVDSLQRELTQKKAAWTPKDNWVNQLPLDQVKRMMGYPEKVRKDKEVSFAAVMGGGIGLDPPAGAIDWRNKDGQNWVSPVLNQGNCGSCVAFAAVGTLETQMNISRQYPWLNLQFSTDALFACGGGACEMGWYPSSATSYMKTRGVPDEACAPYKMGATGQDISCSSICSDASSRSQKITNINTPVNPAAVKAALRHGPLITTMDVSSDFILYGSGIYKRTSGDYLGGHAISIVGYNDTERYWIIRNSWGQDWGENGFARVSYDDDSGVGDSTWGFDVPNADGIVTIRNLRDNDYFSGNVALEAVSTFANTTDLSLAITGANGTRNSLNCQSDSCALSLDTTKFADGRYEAALQANHANLQSISEKRFFYIVNKQPQLNLAFRPEKGLNLQAPIKGRVVFDVDALSSSVPLSHMRLEVKQAGKVVYTKGTQVVVDHMTMGWRTMSVPNGTYQISLVGGVKAGVLEYSASSNEFTVTVRN